MKEAVPMGGIIMRHAVPCVSIPRDNLFHACLHLRAVVLALEKAQENNELADDDEDVCIVDGDLLATETSTVLALLIDTFPEEDNRALALHLSEALRIEFEDGLVFERPGGSCAKVEHPLSVPVPVCHDACENLFVSEIIEDLASVIHVLKKCQKTLEEWIGKSRVRARSYEQFKKSPPDIEIDIVKYKESLSPMLPQ